MPVKAETAKVKKKRLGKTRAVPVKKSRSERKNGLRDRLKIPVVTSFPVLFSLRPKRSEVPKWFKVIFKIKTEITTAKTPVNLINSDSKKKFVKTSGSVEKPCSGRVISARNSRKKTAKNG